MEWRKKKSLVGLSFSLLSLFSLVPSTLDLGCMHYSTLSVLSSMVHSVRVTKGETWAKPVAHFITGTHFPFCLSPFVFFFYLFFFLSVVRTLRKFTINSANESRAGEERIKTGREKLDYRPSDRLSRNNVQSNAGRIAKELKKQQKDCAKGQNEIENLTRVWLSRAFSTSTLFCISLIFSLSSSFLIPRFSFIFAGYFQKDPIPRERVFAKR